MSERDAADDCGRRAKCAAGEQESKLLAKTLVLIFLQDYCVQER